MRAILERDGKNDTADESDTWGASDEEVRLSITDVPARLVSPVIT